MYSAVNSIFHISIRINYNRISEGLTYVLGGIFLRSMELADVPEAKNCVMEITWELQPNEFQRLRVHFVCDGKSEYPWFHNTRGCIIPVVLYQAGLYIIHDFVLGSG
jgi:hypothetical protein